MITKRYFTVILIAAAAGFAGGLASSKPRDVQAADATVIRARRFELVDDSGKTISYWGFDDRYQGRLVIAFTGGKSGELAGFGLGDQSGFLTLTGTDGRQRARLYVGWHEKPSLVLGDEKWSSRVGLGFTAGDAPSENDDNWALTFWVPHFDVGLRNPIPAEIGYAKNASGTGWDGEVYVKNGAGKVWRAP